MRVIGSLKARALLGSCFFLLSANPIDIVRDGSTFRVVGWTDGSKYASQRLAEFVTVSVDAPDVPPLLGQVTMDQDSLVFTPRYPLESGMRYRVSVKLPNVDPIVKTFELPKRDTTPTTGIEHVFPSTNVLPENQLKFYIHFSSAMSRGEAYERIHLLDEKGAPIEFPFLELAEELWDQEGRRLTIFFDPGRIKRGLVSHNEAGVPIEEGKKYTLVIDSSWLDANGKPLRREFQKSFSVGPADRKPLDLKSWKITSPVSGTIDPVSIEFPEPLDHALLTRQLEVTDSAGNALDGTYTTDREETRWHFSPSTPWKRGNFEVRIGTIIADLAGNMIDRPFEVDVFNRIDERLTREIRTLHFNVN